MAITILGIETSCDDCSVALVRRQAGTYSVLRHVTAHQNLLHRPYGGVVPELASRSHLLDIQPALEQVLGPQLGPRLGNARPDAIAVTTHPGLIGSLLVGVSAAKALAYAWNIPLVPVHHLEGHIASLLLSQHQPQFPLLLALLSGGHTNLYALRRPPHEWTLNELENSLVGFSRDDAAGECFDKTAKILGFPYPGGVWIDRYAASGDPKRYAFPRPLAGGGTELSFSGIKTAVAQLVPTLGPQLDHFINDLCASIQAAIVGHIVEKIQNAALMHGLSRCAIVGGVAANSYLRTQLSGRFSDLYAPPIEYCTDNGAMIAIAGALRLDQGSALVRPDLLRLSARSQ